LGFNLNKQETSNASRRRNVLWAKREITDPLKASIYTSPKLYVFYLVLMYREQLGGLAGCVFTRRNQLQSVINGMMDRSLSQLDAEMSVGPFFKTQSNPIHCSFCRRKHHQICFWIWFIFTARCTL